MSEKSLEEEERLNQPNKVNYEEIKGIRKTQMRAGAGEREATCPEWAPQKYEMGGTGPQADSVRRGCRTKKTAE